MLGESLHLYSAGRRKRYRGEVPHCPFPSTPVGFPFIGHALSLLYLSIMLVGEEHVIRKLFFLVRRTADSWKEARMQKQNYILSM